MRYRVDVSTDAQKQLFKFPRDVRERIEHVIDEFEAKDDSQWKYPDRSVVEISAILIKSKDTYR